MSRHPGRAGLKSLASAAEEGAALAWLGRPEPRVSAAGEAARAEADKQKAAAARKDNCQRARDQLATLDSGQRIARIKADGEREILDDDMRAKETKRARDIIASECR